MSIADTSICKGWKIELSAWPDQYLVSHPNFRDGMPQSVERAQALTWAPGKGEAIAAVQRWLKRTSPKLFIHRYKSQRHANTAAREFVQLNGGSLMSSKSRVILDGEEHRFVTEGFITKGLDVER